MRLYIQVAYGLLAAPFEQCASFDGSDSATVLAVLCFFIPVATYLLASVVSLYLGRVLHTAFSLTLMFNEILLLVAGETFPAMRSSPPTCAIGQTKRICHESAVSTCLCVFFAIHQLRYRRYEHPRQVMGLVWLVAYLIGGMWAPVHLDVFSWTESAVGAAVGTLSALAGVLGLHYGVVRHMGNAYLDTVLEFLGLDLGDDFVRLEKRREKESMGNWRRERGVMGTPAPTRRGISELKVFGKVASD